VKQNGICAVISPNMSLGVNSLFKLSEQLAKLLPNYDIEIIEAHHNRKQDVPSGTAMKFAQIIASSLEKDIEEMDERLYDYSKNAKQYSIDRLEKGDRCILALYNDKIIGYIWVMRDTMEITQFKHISLSKNMTASPYIIPFFVPPNDKISTPTFPHMSLNLTFKNAAALHKRAPSI
jgi:4-hydroxy-tetrahydrodipicolinate reductase